ncbi:MAG: M24 family metallopeptidase [Gemmatimonas sp.]|nr:M24 family metallopeptidase [Gemmatimonas sp.]
MAITELTVSLTREALARIQDLLKELELDAWLLYDFRGINSIATGVLGLPALTRRFFVLLPADGTPIALTHRIEQQPWRGWIGENRVYLTWQSLETGLRELLAGMRDVAIESFERDGVPYLDRVPAGVLELIESTGVQCQSSGDLVSAFYSRWSAEGEASHDRAATALRRVAHEAFGRIGDELREGREGTEWDLRQWITGRLAAEGLSEGVDAVVAATANAANPHYAPGATGSASIERGDLVLIDLWGKESAEAVFADQTWMGFVGGQVPDRIETLWRAVRDGRDAAVDFIREKCVAGDPVFGWEVDDVTRNLISERGFGDTFIHRTGHSIDRELHGSGPNIDNLETRDTRRLIPGIGFSIEPGIYLPGEVGLRSEIDVLMNAEGPRVTTPEPQQSIFLIEV